MNCTLTVLFPMQSHRRQTYWSLTWYPKDQGLSVSFFFFTLKVLGYLAWLGWGWISVMSKLAKIHRGKEGFAQNCGISCGGWMDCFLVFVGCRVSFLMALSSVFLFSFFSSSPSGLNCLWLFRFLIKTIPLHHVIYGRYIPCIYPAHSASYQNDHSYPCIEHPCMSIDVPNTRGITRRPHCLITSKGRIIFSKGFMNEILRATQMSSLAPLPPQHRVYIYGFE